jgi:segregation and condensation protein B
MSDESLLHDTPPGSAETAESEEVPSFESLDREQVRRLLHAFLFVSNRPVPLKRLAEVLGDVPVDVIERLLKELAEEINQNAALPYTLRQVGGGYQLLTKPELAPFLRRFLQVKRTKKFSRSVLETLAVIAYKQPVTRAEVEAIRGVSVTHAFEQLLERRLIRVSGVADLPGRPKLYRTTDEFLIQFGLNSLEDLPTLEDLQDLL